MKKQEVEQVSIKAPNMQTISLEIEGTVPLCINRFAQKAIEKMQADQRAGSTKKGKKEREAKDFEALYEGAKHKSEEEWLGFAASALRNGAVSACRAVGYKMTHAKLAFFVEPDGFDMVDGTPLVKITKGEPEQWVAPARNSTGVIDLRSRPLWRAGWRAKPRIRFDADMFTRADIVNLVARIGLQVGIGEGRPDSKMSAGIGLGLFKVL